MTQKQAIQLFEQRKVRTVWDDDAGKWYVAIVDVVAVLTDSIDAAAYWRKLKQRLKAEGNETVTSCHGLKMPAADGKMRMTDVADTEQLFRLIQSIPSPKAEPFKLWLASLGRGIKRGQEFATLTDIITQGWSGMTTRQYKRYKGLKTESLRDNMTNLELVLNMLAEATTTEISKERRPRTFAANRIVAAQGGRIAGNTRREIEAQTGKKIVSRLNAEQVLAAKEIEQNEEEKE